MAITRRAGWYILLYLVLMGAVVALFGCGGDTNGGTTQTYTASCSDGSTRMSWVSQAEADAMCPVVHTATCGDGTVRTSYVSEATAANLCPSFTMPGSTYNADKKSAFDRLNADRIQCGFGAVQQNTLMDQAAQNHANYDALNISDNRHEEIPGNPGFTGTAPPQRMQAVGYKYVWLQEGLPMYLWWGTSYTYPDFQPEIRRWAFTEEPSSLMGLRNLYTLPYHMATMLGNYREIGIGAQTMDHSLNASKTAFFKHTVFNYGIPEGQVATTQGADKLLTFPCEGMTDVNPYQLKEEPDPFPNSGDRSKNPYGTPVYLRAAEGATLVLNSGTITQRSTGVAVPTVQLNKANDPQAKLLANQIFLSPTDALAENAVYDVVLIGTNSAFVSASNPTGAFDRRFSFTTSTWVGQ